MRHLLLTKSKHKLNIMCKTEHASQLTIYIHHCISVGKNAMNFFHRKECIDSVKKLKLEFKVIKYVQSYLLVS